MRRARHLACQLPRSVFLDDHSVFGKLLLYEDNLFLSLGYEITAGVVRALVHLSQFCVILACEHTVAAPQHDGHPTDGQPVAYDSLLPSCVLDVDRDESRVGYISEAALVWRGYTRHIVRLLNLWHSDVNIEVFEVEHRVGGRNDLSIGQHDFTKFCRDKVIEGIDVLADEAPHRQECWHQFPLVPQFFNRRRHFLNKRDRRVRTPSAGGLCCRRGGSHG